MTELDVIFNMNSNFVIDTDLLDHMRFRFCIDCRENLVTLFKMFNI